LSEEWYDGAYFNRRFIFRFGDCDSRKKASLFSVMKFCSELAGEDYERRGLGYEYLRERGQALLLSRIRLRFARMPEHTESVVASTWERFDKGPFFYRDFEIRTKEGELLAAGSTQWFLVDIISREVLRPSSLAEGQRSLDPRKSPAPECDKLKKRSSLPFLGSRQVYYTDLDGNGHVNNAVYAKIAVDFLPEELQQRPISDFSINYFMETKPHETLEICGAATDTGYIIQGASDGVPHFACEFWFKDDAAENTI